MTRENCIQTLVPANKSYSSLTFPGMKPQAKQDDPGGRKKERKKKKEKERKKERKKKERKEKKKEKEKEMFS